MKRSWESFDHDWLLYSPDMNDTVHIHGDVVYKFAEPNMDGAERHAVEEKIYVRLGHHHRILHYLGKDKSSGAFRFPYLRNGTVGHFLMTHPNPPLDLRLRWIIQLAEGIAYLHSHSIVWVDCHLNNVLLTDDLDVVLSDFAGSRIDDERQSVQPPPCYLLPCLLEHDVLCPVTQDLFAFGTCVFILLSLKLPHRSQSYSTDISITFEDLLWIAERHQAGDFDSLSEETFPGLAEVVEKCWRLEYASMEQVVEHIREHVAYLRGLKDVRKSILIRLVPY
jgi:serine/threonine protein kinase